MRLLMTGLTLFVALCLTAPAGDARAPKPPLYTGATVEFRDWDGDSITSDGNPTNTVAPYVNGGNAGLEVRVWINGSQDVTVGTFQSGRKIHFSYTPAVVFQPSAPTGSLVDNAFVNIRNIGAMVVGSTKITRASFNTAVGHFRWLGGPNPGTGATTPDESYGSLAVVVTRTSPTTWDVHTPVPAESGYVDGSPAVNYTAGDLSVLLKEAKGKLTPVGLYHMPFGLTVTCTACPAP